MIAVLFEVWMDPEQKDAYLAIAASLREDLQHMDGFISVERFQSLVDSNKLLSMSFWRDEEAVAGWRKLQAHREAQAMGRNGVFTGYRLRVAAVLRDYGMDDRQQAPADSRESHG